MQHRRGTLVRAALLTGLVSLLCFGVAHAAFITPLVERDPDLPLIALIGAMIGAPMMFGAIPTLVASLLAAAAWSATRARGRLRSWRFGAALGGAFVPIIVASVVLGPLGDQEPSAVLVVGLFAMLGAVPAAIGWWAGGARAAILMALTIVPTGFLNTMFLLGGGIGVWTGLFAASIVTIWVASGWWMETFVRRFSRPVTPAEGAAHPSG